MAYKTFIEDLGIEFFETYSADDEANVSLFD